MVYKIFNGSFFIIIIPGFTISFRPLIKQTIAVIGISDLFSILGFDLGQSIQAIEGNVGIGQSVQISSFDILYVAALIIRIFLLYLAI